MSIVYDGKHNYTPAKFAINRVSSFYPFASQFDDVTLYCDTRLLHKLTGFVMKSISHKFLALSAVCTNLQKWFTLNLNNETCIQGCVLKIRLIIIKLT